MEPLQPIPTQMPTLTPEQIKAMEKKQAAIKDNLDKLQKKQLHFVFGAVKDKDLKKVLTILPKEAYYYFCKAAIPRGLDATVLQNQAQEFQLKGASYNSVKEAYEAAQKAAKEDDCIFVGGSIFVVAEVV